MDSYKTGLRALKSGRKYDLNSLELLIYAVVTILFLFFLMGAFRMPPVAARAPIVVSSAGLLLLLFQLCKTFWQTAAVKKSGHSEGSLPEPATDIHFKLKTRRFFLSLFLSTGYILLMGTIGYLIATALFVGTLIGILSEGRIKWFQLASIAVGTAAAMYLVFGLTLKIPLPRATLW